VQAERKRAPSERRLALRGLPHPDRSGSATSHSCAAAAVVFPS
jgi:hypothetical protein